MWQKKLYSTPVLILLAALVVGGWLANLSSSQSSPPNAGQSSAQLLAATPAPSSSEDFRVRPTARCRDGSYSYSAHRSGTCSHHGGVAVWNPNP